MPNLTCRNAKLNVALSGIPLLFHLVWCRRQVVLVEGIVRLDAVAAVGTDDEEEGAGHVAVGKADAGVEVELAFFGMIEAQSVHETVFLEIARELALEVGLCETAIEELLAVLHDEKLETVVLKLYTILVNHLWQFFVGLAGDGKNNFVAALHQRIGIGIVGQLPYTVIVLICLVRASLFSLLRIARCEKN